MRTAIYKIGVVMMVAISFASCVKDDLFNTPHPVHGALVVTTDWNGKSSEADIPQAYTLRVGDVEQSATGATNVFNTLLDPGTHALTVYNLPSEMAISGNLASVSGTLAGHIAPEPGYLFSAHQAINVAVDDTLRTTAVMKQYVRKLEFQMTATEGDYARVSSATATLSGVASAIDFVTGERSATALTMNSFTQEDNKFTATFRLLGVVPAENQTLTVDITFSNGDTQRVVSDLSGLLAGFNDAVEPLILTGELSLPVEGGFSATIGGWQQADGGNTDAH